MDKYLYIPYLITESTYSGRCNLGHECLLQTHVRKRGHYWSGLFKGLLDRHKYAFIGGGTQIKIETETSLNSEGLKFRLFGPFKFHGWIKYSIKYKQFNLYYWNTAICCCQHSSVRAYDAVKQFQKAPACFLSHWSRWTVNDIQLRCKLSLTHSTDESFSNAVL